jgi:cystathionine gamma-synthase
MTLHTNRSNASLLDQLAQRCKDTCFCSFGDEIGLRLFPDSASAGACVSYITNSMSHGAEALPACLVRKHKITFDGSPTSRHDCQHGRPAPLWAVVYPESARASAASFWRLTGLGISSRLSEACLERTISTDPTTQCSEVPKALACTRPDVYDKLRGRIADMLARATTGPPSRKLVSPSDVFLFPSGMSTIYHVHHMLLQWRNGGSVMMGFPYELTLKILETYGPSCQVYSSNSSSDIDGLEQYLVQKASDRTAGSRLQAIWCECPSNPLLWTPDLQKIRELADQYDLAVIVDDTIGSSANVDVLNAADVVVTSLTKSFSGFADVMAGRYRVLPRHLSNPHF